MLQGQPITGGGKHVAYIETVQKRPSSSRQVPYVPDAGLVPMYEQEGSYPEADDMLVNDPRSDAAFRAWGSRRVSKAEVLRRDIRSANGLPSDHRYAPGKINVRCLKRIARIPSSALDVDPIFREPARAAGGHTFLTPYHMQYQYYKRFGNAGCHDLTAAHHNFPIGDVPLPRHVYTDDPQSRVTLIRNTRQKLYATVALGTDRTFPSPLYNYHQ